MIVNGIDMNYLGVYSVWNNDLGTVLSSVIFCYSSSD